MRPVRPLIALLAAAVVTVAGCSSGSTSPGSATPTPGSTTSSTSSTSMSTSSAATSGSDSSSSASSSAPSAESSGGVTSGGGGGEVTGTVVVFAAASLQKTFDELATTFQSQHPGTKVEISYDGSSTLVTQLTQGAVADVFASADEKNMTKVTDAGLITDTPPIFATNTLQIAVKPGNPKGITTLADLAKDGVATVVCAPEVPCGSAAQTALKAAGVTLDPASEEQKVTDVLTKVADGDADAGLVYKTDVSGSDGKVDGVDFAEASAAVNKYPIGVLKDAPNATGAQAFVDLVTGTEGQKVLAAAGFGAP